MKLCCPYVYDLDAVRRRVVELEKASSEKDRLIQEHRNQQIVSTSNDKATRVQFAMPVREARSQKRKSTHVRSWHSLSWFPNPQLSPIQAMERELQQLRDKTIQQQKQIELQREQEAVRTREWERQERDKEQEMEREKEREKVKEREKEREREREVGRKRNRDSDTDVESIVSSSKGAKGVDIGASDNTDRQTIRGRGKDASDSGSCAGGDEGGPGGVREKRDIQEVGHNSTTHASCTKGDFTAASASVPAADGELGWEVEHMDRSAVLTNASAERLRIVKALLSARCCVSGAFMQALLCDYVCVQMSAFLFANSSEACMIHMLFDSYVPCRIWKGGLSLMDGTMCAYQFLTGVNLLVQESR